MHSSSAAHVDASGSQRGTQTGRMPSRPMKHASSAESHCGSSSEPPHSAAHVPVNASSTFQHIAPTMQSSKPVYGPSITMHESPTPAASGNASRQPFPNQIGSMLQSHGMHFVFSGQS